MKRILRPVYAAQEDRATKFYKISKDDLLNNMLWKDNVWVQYRILNFDLEDALDFRQLEGSFVYNETFYYMVSDYKTVTIDGQDIEPEELRDALDFDQLLTFVEATTPTDIIKKITDSDLNWRDLNIAESAKAMLDDYDLAQIASDAEEIGLIELK